MKSGGEGGKLFRVSDACADLGIRAGAILFEGVRIGPSPPELEHLVDQEIRVLRSRFTTPAALRSTPEIEKLHSIFRAVGAHPRKLQPACERLVHMALKRGRLVQINNLVDAYNLMSLHSICSLGAHDLEKLALPIQLRILRGGEEFIPMGSQEPEACGIGEFVYVDAADRVICRLDVRQAEFSKITSKSTRVLLIVGATTALDLSRLETLFSETTDLIEQYCGGTSEIIHFPPADLSRTHLSEERP